MSGIGNTIQGPTTGIDQEWRILRRAVTAIKGRHNMLKSAASSAAAVEDFDHGFFFVGRFVFNGTYTGDSFADFLLGRAVEFDHGQGANQDGDAATRTVGAFFQDDWKVRDNLTLNLGVRYDYYSPITDELGQTSTFVVQQPTTACRRAASAR